MSSLEKRKARCPFCGFHIQLRDETEEWDLVICRECNTPLQVVRLYPPELDYVEDTDLESEGDWEEG